MSHYNDHFLLHCIYLPAGSQMVILAMTWEKKNKEISLFVALMEEHTGSLFMT